VKAYSEAEGLEVLAPDRPRGEAFLSELRALEADVFVVVAYGHILSREVFDMPKFGSVNAHASLLPDLRGAAPIAWAVAGGHDLTGITVMRIVEELDAGPILLQGELPIDPSESASELTNRLAELGAGLIIEALALLEVAGLDEREQDHSRATYAPKLDRKAARVRWEGTATPVSDHIRGMDAAPGAWTELEGQPLKVYRSEPLPLWSHAVAPGSILAADAAEGLVVATGQGGVRIGEVQAAGGRRMQAGEWLRGRPLPDGSRFT